MTFAAVDNRRKVERQRDAETHLRLYPRHNLLWRNGEPFYCDGSHDPGEDHDWTPVPEYQRNHG